jgi:long-subunit fatty acid transport protein
MRNRILATALASLFVPGLAAAAEQYADDLMYLRPGAGASKVDSPDTGTETAYSLGGGWRFARHYSIDLNYDHLGSWGTTVPGVGGGFDAKSRTLSFGLGGTIDFGQSGFFGQARVGVHRWQNRFDTGTDPFYSLGVGYDIGKRLGIILSYERFVVDSAELGDVDRLMLGFEVR